jgi:hypothetical protein
MESVAKISTTVTLPMACVLLGAVLFIVSLRERL